MTSSFTFYDPTTFEMRDEDHSMSINDVSSDNSSEMNMPLHVILENIEDLSISRLRQLSDTHAMIHFNFDHIFPFIQQSYQLKIEWYNSRIKDIELTPSIPCNDIIEISKRENDIHFLYRELSNRIICYSQRKDEMETISKKFKVQYNCDQEYIKIKFMRGRKPTIMTLYCPWEYPFRGSIQIKDISTDNILTKELLMKKRSRLNETLRENKKSIAEVVKDIAITL